MKTTFSYFPGMFGNIIWKKQNKKYDEILTIYDYECVEK